MKRIEGDGFHNSLRRRSSLIADFCNKIGQKRIHAVHKQKDRLAAKISTTF
jgi:hypothetical protein